MASGSRDRSTPPSQAPSERTQVKRGAKRANYDADAIHAILDANWLCHVAVPVNGVVRVLPTAYARIGDEIVIHGSSKSGMLLALADNECCVCVTLVDGLVLARSAFSHSVNYRSVVCYARAREVIDETEKRAALDDLVDHIIPGRSRECRPANDAELKATGVWAIPIQEASAKIRSGPPNDGPDDIALPFWAGELPLSIRREAPVSAPNLRADIGFSDAVQDWVKSR